MKLPTDVTFPENPVRSHALYQCAHYRHGRGAGINRIGRAYPWMSCLRRTSGTKCGLGRFDSSRCRRKRIGSSSIEDGNPRPRRGSVLRRVYDQLKSDTFRVPRLRLRWAVTVTTRLATLCCTPRSRRLSDRLFGPALQRTRAFISVIQISRRVQGAVPGFGCSGAAPCWLTR